MLTSNDLLRHAAGPVRLSPLTFVATEEEARLISAACRAVDLVHRFAATPGDTEDDVDESTSLAAQFGAAWVRASMLPGAIGDAIRTIEALAEGGLDLSIDRAQTSAMQRVGADGLAVKIDRRAFAPGACSEMRTDHGGA